MEQDPNFIAKAFDAGGPVMYVIAAVGFLSIFLIIERFLALRNLTINKRDFTNQIYDMIRRGDIRQAIAFCDSKPTPLTATLKHGLVSVLNKRPDEEIQVAMDASILRETPKFEGWASFLAVFGNIAVLIGLLGTIIGMIISFEAMAQVEGAEKAKALAEGIAHALNATAFGLSVAIIAIVGYGYFQHRIQRAENDVVESSMTVMNLIVANRDKLKET